MMNGLGENMWNMGWGWIIGLKADQKYKRKIST